MPFQTTVLVELENIRCGSCSVPHGVPKSILDAARADRSKGWYCPNGHRLVFKTSEADRLKNDLAAARRELDRERNHKEYFEGRLSETQKEKDHVTRQLNGTRGYLKTVKARIAGGVCPCCNRTFVNVGRHMENKHPNFKAE